MTKNILQKVSPESPSSSSPNSAEINEEKQETDDSLPKQQPQPSVQEFPIPQNPIQEIQNPKIPNPQNPDQETTNPEKRTRPQLVDKFYERRKRPRKSESEGMPAKPLGISLDSIPTFKPKIRGMELAEDCILFASTSTSEEDDDVKMMKYVRAFLGGGKPVPQGWSDHQALFVFLVDCGESVSIEDLEKKLAKLKNKFFMVMDRLRLFPSSLLTEYEDNLHGFGKQVWGDEFLWMDADRELREMYPRDYDDSADGEIEEENAELDAMYQANKAKKGDDCMLFERSTSEEEDDVKMMNYVRDHVVGGNPFPKSADDYTCLCGVINTSGESISPKVFEKKLDKLKYKYFLLMEKLGLSPGMTVSEYDDHLRKFGNKYWGSKLGDLGYGFYGMNEETLKHHYAEIDAMCARNRELKKDKLLPMMPQKEANQGQEEDCILFEGSTSQEDDDIRTMKCFQSYVQYGDTSLEISTSEENLRELYKFITSRHHIKSEVLRQKVTKLMKTYSVLRDRMRYFEEMYQLGEVVWGPMMLRGNQSGFGKLSQMKRLEKLNQYEQKFRQKEVELALLQLYGKKGDEWAKEYKKKVETILMDDEQAKPGKKDQRENEELFREKSATLFKDDWEVAEDCILFTRSTSEKEDDILTLNCIIAYINQETLFEDDCQVADDSEVFYGLLISKSGVCISSIEVLKKKLAKLLSKYLMLMERIRLYSRMYWTEYDDSLHKLGTCVWGSRMLEGNLPLLDSRGIGIKDQENATIAKMRASARRRRQGRRFRFSQDPTIGRSRIIRPPSFSTSVDEAFDSRPATNSTRELVVRETGKQADDHKSTEAVQDDEAKGKQHPKDEAPTEKPTKFQCVEQLLLLFQGAKTKVEDDLILLRYASAYGRNVTSPTAAELYEFILANLPAGDSISWFILKLKLAMLERRYLSILGMLVSNGVMEAYNTVYYRELYRMGRQFWGDEIADHNPDGDKIVDQNPDGDKIADQNPDGNMGTRGASGSSLPRCLWK